MAGEQSSRYDEFIEHVKRLHNLSNVQMLLSWDQQVTMPDGGTPARSRQLSTISALSHELLASDETADHLDALEAAGDGSDGSDGSDSSDAGELSAEQQAVVREIRRRHDRAARVPTDLVERISRTSSEALEVWEGAKADDDFDAFAPKLEELVELRRKYANYIDPDADPYAVLFAEYEPYLDLETAERVLGRLRDRLVPLIDDVRASDVELAVDAFDGTFDADTQEALSRDALTLLGYDWDRGRLDTSSHPFTSGNQFDTRITTRFDEHNPLDALTATIHEFGHATYQLGLPQEHYATPLGSPRDLTVHESQSRLWENHVGRSQAWWELFLPAFKKRFPSVDAVTPRQAYEAANQVYEDNFIRVEADELTYHMHVVLRFEIERDLISGDLDVREVPQVWNDRMEEYLGIRPPTDAVGCLQDVHWSHGNFGYFPTYTLGSVLATQLYDAVTDDVPDVEERTREGEFDALHEWLTENVHRHGSQYTTPDLIEKATGEAYSADPFLDYVETKYGDLYDL